MGQFFLAKPTSRLPGESTGWFPKRNLLWGSKGLSSPSLFCGLVPQNLCPINITYYSKIFIKHSFQLWYYSIKIWGAINKVLLSSPYKWCIRVVHKGGLKHFLSIMLKEIRETSGISREMVDLNGDGAMLSCAVFLHPLNPIGLKGRKLNLDLCFKNTTWKLPYSWCHLQAFLLVHALKASKSKALLRDLNPLGVPGVDARKKPLQTFPQEQISPSGFLP